MQYESFLIVFKHSLLFVLTSVLVSTRQMKQECRRSRATGPRDQPALRFRVNVFSSLSILRKRHSKLAQVSMANYVDRNTDLRAFML